MLPRMSQSNVDDSRHADAVPTGGGAVGLTMEDDFLDLFFCKGGPVMGLAHGGHSIIGTILGVIEMRTQREVVGVDALHVTAHDMADDLSFGDRSILRHPRRTCGQHRSKSDLDCWASSFVRCSGPFETSGCRPYAEKCKAFQNGISAGPVVPGLGKVFFRDVSHENRLCRVAEHVN